MPRLFFLASPLPFTALGTPRATGARPETESPCLLLPSHSASRNCACVRPHLSPNTRTGLTPAQLTALNMDRSTQLAAAAAAHWGGDVRGLVGELQFAFIAFVFGQSLQGESLGRC